MKEENQQVDGYAKRSIWQWLLLYAVIAVLVYGLFYYFVLAKNNGNSSSQTGIYQQNTSPTTTSQAQTPAVIAQKITIEGSEFAFTPSTATLKKGQTTEITFKNIGKFPHNLTIADLGVKSKTIMPGEQDIFTITPDKMGNFPFICSVDSHADKGMTGTFTVE